MKIVSSGHNGQKIESSNLPKLALTQHIQNTKG